MKPGLYIAMAGATLLAACASSPPPPMAVVEITDKICDAEPDLLTPQALAPEKPKKLSDEIYQFKNDTPCFTKDGLSTNYMVFALPSQTENLALTIGGLKAQHRTLAADIAILNEEGEITRRFDREKYMDIGSVFGVQFRPRDGEAFVLVTTDPERVGEAVVSHETRLLQSQGYTGTGGSYTTFSGAESLSSRTFSHEGMLRVRVQALKGKIGDPNA